MTGFALAAELVLCVFCLLLLVIAAIGMWREDRRAEKEDLDSYYAQNRRLPL